MGQDWKLINLDRREHWGLSKLGEAFFDSNEVWHLEQLFLPTPSVYIGEAPPMKDTTIDIRTSLNSSVFSRLPLELYDIICESMGDYLDCVCLGLTCRFLWGVARRHVHKRYVEEVPVSWCKGRIIKEEEEEYNTPLPTGWCDYCGQHEPDTLPSHLNAFAGCFFTEKPARRDVVANLNVRARYDSAERHFHPCAHPNDFQILRNMLSIPGKPIIQEVKVARPLVLRNLSKKVYVREEAIDRLMEDNPDLAEYYEDIFLAHVLLMRVCWSSCDSVAMCNPIALHRGSWAGDRFDYVSARDFRTEEEGDDGQVVEWRDVSDEAMRDLQLLWKA